MSIEAMKQEPVDLSPFYCGTARIVNGEYKLMDVRNVDALVNNWHPIYAIPENYLNGLYTTPPAAQPAVPFTKAQIERLYRNTAPASRAESLAAFVRVVRTVEAAHGIGEMK